MDRDDLPAYELDNGAWFSVAGYEYGGKWRDVENGAGSIEWRGRDSISNSDRVTVWYQTPGGDEKYVTIHGPFNDWDHFWEAVEYQTDPYSEQ